MDESDFCFEKCPIYKEIYREPIEPGTPLCARAVSEEMRGLSYRFQLLDAISLAIGKVQKHILRQKGVVSSRKEAEAASRVWVRTGNVYADRAKSCARAMMDAGEASTEVLKESIADIADDADIASALATQMKNVKQ